MPSSPRRQKSSESNGWSIVAPNWEQMSPPPVGLATLVLGTKAAVLASSATRRSLMDANLSADGMAPCLPTGFFCRTYPASFTSWHTNGPPCEMTSTRSHAGAWTLSLGMATSAPPLGAPASRACISSLTLCCWSSLFTTRTLVLDASRTASLTVWICRSAPSSRRMRAMFSRCSSCPYHSSGHSCGSTDWKACRRSPARSRTTLSCSRCATLTSSNALGRISFELHVFTASTSSSVSHPMRGAAAPLKSSANAGYKPEPALPAPGGRLGPRSLMAA
mmetsp:Transcript_48485/g.109151  ORF Transcript_48485/g.109151 Transcript_48485/m.109151 type:complete len:277 (+) Transcript_48485:616-1446(+)